ncbi:tyrosine kinase [Invertebrate iridescent virus 22]|uniref:Tyrosine kinase n=1 Tax=Invertebrate iridescent virus 22 TaxID=345198 RepID=S6DCZ5_9VIRU|nr:tyrosine kinase [Invertebrate iridescent virus 22]CCV01792.1 tyrosine kinase [Invertebrate iridescent virus 22]
MKEEEIIANLSHSYFNHLFKDVQPFLDYFNSELVVKSKDLSSEVVERLFFMACLYSSDILLPHCDQSISKKKLKKQDWLHTIKPFGSKSKQGVVNKCIIFDKIFVVVKKPKTSKFDEITLRDFCVGIHLNKILNEAPFFVRTLGCFISKSQFHIATEFIDGINLKIFIQNKKNTFVDFLNIFFQILLGLEIAQNKLNFSHYDLHTDNIILVPTTKCLKISLYGYIYTIKHTQKPVIIDFGLSSVCTKGKTLGQKSLETKGIYPHLSPGYDIYVFLLFCLDVAQSSNSSIFKGITDLLLFFKVETNLPLNLLTNNHIKCLKKGVSNCIPFKFIQYILQNYFAYLNVEVEPKKYNDQCLGKQPLFLKLKQIFDINNELELVPVNIHYKKGFIKTLVDNIKTYYWYSKKIELTPTQIERLIEIDIFNLQNLIDDLNLILTKKGEDKPYISIEQKNLFFASLDYYYLILELELHHQYPFYKLWIQNFKNTFVYRNVFKHLHLILSQERLKRLQHI